MLNSRRNRRGCTWGCCNSHQPSRTSRTREKRAVARLVRSERW